MNASDSTIQQKVLIVDDDESNRLVMRRIVIKEGYSPILVQSGKEALEVLAHTDIDAVLLDWMMPGMTGIDVLRAIKQNPDWRLLPVIMVTARAMPDDLRTGLEAGATDYITKPIDKIELIARIRASLRERDLRLELERSNTSLKELNTRLELRTRFIRKVFGRYMSDEVVTSLLESPNGLAMGGDKRTVTIMMTDLRGFTSLTEKLKPEAVVDMLNNYIEVMTGVVSKYQGTINELIGDAIMILFGAPVARDDDALRAAACAVEMQMAMAEVNERNRKAGLPKLEMGIGVHTGEVIAGNIGSSKRSKYSVVGSNVNLTARIESCTVGGQILVSESTLRAGGADLSVGQRNEVSFKGLERPMPFYELRGVGARHNLFLPAEEETFTALEKPVRVLFAIIVGKVASGETYAGEIVRLSAKGMVIDTKRRVRPFSDLAFVLPEGCGPGEEARFYGKVISSAGDHPSSHIIRFTSVPERVGAFFNRLINNPGASFAKSA